MTSARSCNVKLLCEAGNIVGESIVWDDRSHRLVWIDILGQRIYRFAPASGKLTIHPWLDQPVYNIIRYPQ